jgi:hypothetical protein
VAILLFAVTELSVGAMLLLTGHTAVSGVAITFGLWMLATTEHRRARLTPWDRFGHIEPPRCAIKHASVRQRDAW